MVLPEKRWGEWDWVESSLLSFAWFPTQRDSAACLTRAELDDAKSCCQWKEMYTEQILVAKNNLCTKKEHSVKRRNPVKCSTPDVVTRYPRSDWLMIYLYLSTGVLPKVISQWTELALKPGPPIYIFIWIYLILELFTVCSRALTDPPDLLVNPGSQAQM